MTLNKKMLHLSDLLRSTRYSGQYEDVEIKGVSSDSRSVKPGFLFAALQGVKVDGAKFIADAIRAGAVAILVQDNCDLKFLEKAKNVVIIKDENPRCFFSQLVANFYQDQPEYIAAVTGTNGKTSTVNFIKQIWQQLGVKSASMGTVGISDTMGKFEFERINFLTTPDTVKLHEILAKLKQSGVTHLAMEASSHGLDQCRLHGVKVNIAAFTNLTRDHLDYHGTVAAYFEAKQKLFSEILQEGSVAAINKDIPEFEELVKICKMKKHRVISFGRNGDDIKLLEIEHQGLDQYITLDIEGKQYKSLIKLSGEFQISNLLCAAAVVLGSGFKAKDIVDCFKNITSVPGRMERVLCNRDDLGINVFVDYAHTPDALEKALLVLRPFVKGKLWVVFGCGGNRDKGKRPIMGEIAAKFADKVVVTDDNPRSEDPSRIRAEILKKCKGGIEIGDRKEAIFHAVANLKHGDILLLAGKGHEKTQVFAEEVIPFDDVAVARQAILGETE